MSRISKFFFLLLIFITGNTFVCARTSLKAGMELANPPFEMIDKNGNPQGISVELARAFAKWLDKELVIEDIPFDALIPSIKSGKIDIIISSMSATAKRQKAVLFTRPYLYLGLCLLLNINQNISSVEELDNSSHTVVVKRGTTAQIYANSIFSKANIIILPYESQCIMEVIQSKASAFFYDQLSNYKTAKKYPKKLKVKLDPIVEEGWCAAVNIKNIQLADSFNKFINELEKNNEFQNIVNKYIKQELGDFESLNIPLIISFPQK